MRAAAWVTGLAALVHLAVAVQPLGAQSPRVDLDVGVSHARPPDDVTADPSTYLLGGVRVVTNRLFGAAYGALSADPDIGDWASAVLGWSDVVPVVGRLAAGLTLSGSGFAVGEPTTYRAVVGRATPELRVRAGAWTLIGRGHGGIGRSEVDDRSGIRPVSVVTDLWTYGGGVGVEGALRRVDLRLGLDLYESAAGGYATVHGRVGGELPVGGLAGVRWRAGARYWDTPTDEEVQLELGLAVPLGGRWTVEAAGGRTGPDPLLETPPGVNGSLVATWTAVEPGFGPPPVYSVRGREPDGRANVTFRLERPDAERVSVMGDFSEWEPIEMDRSGNAWTVRVRVEPGVYHFGFLVDGEWYVPESAAGRVTDDFGRENATLVVAPG